MADKIIKIKIDCSKIDKALLFPGKNGAMYLDATFFLKDETDQYGNNGMITQDVSKESRMAGNKGPILGNVKVMGGGQSKPAPKKEDWSTVPPDNDDLPF